MSTEALTPPNPDTELKEEMWTIGSAMAVNDEPVVLCIEGEKTDTEMEDKLRKAAMDDKEDFGCEIHPESVLTHKIYASQRQYFLVGRSASEIRSLIEFALTESAVA